MSLRLINQKDALKPFYLYKKRMIFGSKGFVAEQKLSLVENFTKTNTKLFDDGKALKNVTKY